MHNLRGLDMLLLSTKGRHTGHIKETPLLYVEEGGRYYCAASFAGSDVNPQWFMNLVADTNVELLLRQRRFAAVAHVTTGSERCSAWTKLVEYYSDFAKYQNRTERTIPVVRFESVSYPGVT